MDNLDLEKSCAILNRIMELELAGVVRYTHYALMVTGPYRQPIVDFMKTQATELQWIAINLPDEVVHTLARLSTTEKLLATGNMDPLTKQHLELCEQEAQCKLLGIGLWADGTPCNWDRSETVETLSMNFPGLTGEYRNLRIPVTALSKKMYVTIPGPISMMLLSGRWRS